MAVAKLCILTVLALGAIVAANEEKQGKVWSLFSVVSFKNVPCRSEDGPASSSGINRNGTCFTSTECTSKGGKASGNCAAGFGVCCLFLVSKGATDINQNNTYLQNPGFPAVLTADNARTPLTYTVRKCQDSICMLRLDFEQFTLEGVTLFDDAGVCRDSFEVLTSVKTIAYPVVCGVNTGQHMYIDISDDPGATATLSFKFDAGASTKRTWDIKVSQIECDSRSKPFSDGCLQYLTGTSGRFSTFNFQEATAALQHHLPAQRYSICVRREAGFCCVEYKLCSDTKSYNFDMANDAMTGTLCTLDHILISGFSDECDQGANTVRDTRLCGGKFAAVSNGKIDATVCDCSQPFTVDVNFNAAGPSGPANQRGLCLEYRQRPCNN